jgi:hypothetical protein
VEATKPIKFVAVVVAGVVLAIGGIIIYSIAMEPRKQQNSPDKPHGQPLVVESSASSQPQGTANAAPASSLNSEPEVSGSVVDVPLPSSQTPRQAYLEPPETTTVQEPTMRPASPAEMISQPPSAAAATTSPANPPGSVSAAGLTRPSPETPTANGQPTTMQPWTTGAGETGSPGDQGSKLRIAPVVRRNEVTLTSGTPLKVKLAEPLSTDGSKSGQYFHATLAEPIVRDGFVIAKSGSGVTGKVLAAKHANMLGRVADLRLVLVEIRTADNRIVHVQTASWDDRGRSHNLLTRTVRSTVDAFSGAVAGAAPFRNGSNITLPANAILEFQLAAPVSFSEHARDR